MWLKQYLSFGEDRPLWTLLADDLYARNPTKSCKLRDPRLRINPFLQTWDPSTRGGALPKELVGMLKAAKSHGLRLEALAPSRSIIRALPMWESSLADTAKLRSLASRSRATNCIRTVHKLLTIGDFERLAALTSEPTHDPSKGPLCECEGCAACRHDTGCSNPGDCSRRAELFLDTLPPRWDPRGEHPQDYEEEVWNALPEHEREGCFDRRVTTYGKIGDALRLFTSSEEPGKDRLDMSVDESEQVIEAAVVGCCVRSGEVTATAGDTSTARPSVKNT
ncbi:hypothetical protein C8Q76DRAFT_606417 [Earliella scabrosa]|nr:hypothetical protein C8Q76DRAFT_606417 [Earliella scabrosa]